MPLNEPDETSANPPEGPIDRIMESLRERAKELHCLYDVHELLARSGVSVDEVCRGLIEIIPPGFQHPQVCWAKITLENTVYQTPRASESPWLLRTPIVVQGEQVGTIEVYYTQEMPNAAEGPFLKEERRLIDTIADLVGNFVMQRRLQNALGGWESGVVNLETREKREWWVIVEFLRKTDPQLLTRLSRRMINYLCWSGVEEAQAWLRRLAASLRDQETDPRSENRPLTLTTSDARPAAEDAFAIAGRHLDEHEIVSLVEKWIKDDKAGFLTEAVENQATSVAGMIDALEQFRGMGLKDSDLSRSVQIGLRASLIRRFLTEDLDYINTAKNHFAIEDFSDLVHQLISPTSSHGKLGGKSAGLLLAARIVSRSGEYADTLGDVRMPKSWYITSDGLMNFVDYNHLEDVYNRKYLELDQIRREYPHIVQIFKNSHFSPEMATGLSMALDDFGDRPIIVRSSSLLEDRIGAAFSGKYKSLFLANQGGKSERLAALMDAIAEVYASVFSPDPIEYRAERGLLDVHEEMGIMIQEVVGTRAGRYFLPLFAGVAFSHNEFRWSARIRREDGLLRLVPGLGTRAVDRLGDDYPVLIAPGQPGLRVNVTPDEVMRYAPRRVDLINLETRTFETVEVSALLAECGRELPHLRDIASVYDSDGIRRPTNLGWDPARERAIITFDGLTSDTPFIATMTALLRLLQEKLGGPVDIEFASDGRSLYLLQCRAQSFSQDAAPATIPRDVAPERVVFSANKYVSNGRVPDITHVVYVDPEGYAALPDLPALRDVARAVGRLNKLLPKRQFVLIGPGRWGSRGDVKLGVAVTYSDINNTAMLLELGNQRGYVPDLSFGTHFFQDLVESSIRYLPLFPGDPSITFNERFFTDGPDILLDLLPEYAHLAGILRVIDVPKANGGLVLRVLMNADLDEALGVLVQPAAVQPYTGRRRSSEPADDYWRWRLRMAERIAAELDAGRFGVKAFYVFGSTKNATAGPKSDIDLLLHVAGDAEQTRELSSWLDGWSHCLAEMNFLRTGYRCQGLLDVHFVTDADIARRSSYASKIGAVTDAAHLLPLGTESGSR
jgi:pyruvate, water dikinase